MVSLLSVLLLGKGGGLSCGVWKLLPGQHSGGPKTRGGGLPTLPSQEGIGENQGQYILGPVTVSLLRKALEGRE